MDAFARDFPTPLRRNHAPAHVQELLSALGLARPLDLANPDLGSPVATSRTSWVRRVQIGTIDCYIKTYVYRTLRDRCRGTFRNTGPFRPSRAAREAAALHWLAGRGFTVAPVVGVVDERRVGWVATAILVTAAWPGEPLDRLLPRLEPTHRTRLAQALGQFVAHLHDAGFRDGNLDLRNVLAAPVGDAFVLTKVDSPRYRTVAPGRRSDRRTRADWARLLPQLVPLGLADVAVAAAAATAPPR